MSWDQSGNPMVDLLAAKKLIDDASPPRPVRLWVCPECVQGKHGNCDGSAWDFDADQPTRCGCACQMVGRKS